MAALPTWRLRSRGQTLGATPRPRRRSPAGRGRCAFDPNASLPTSGRRRNKRRVALGHSDQRPALAPVFSGARCRSPRISWKSTSARSWACQAASATSSTSGRTSSPKTTRGAATFSSCSRSSLAATPFCPTTAARPSISSLCGTANSGKQKSLATAPIPDQEAIVRHVDALRTLQAEVHQARRLITDWYPQPRDRDSSYGIARAVPARCKSVCRGSQQSQGPSETFIKRRRDRPHQGGIREHCRADGPSSWRSITARAGYLRPRQRRVRADVGRNRADVADGPAAHAARSKGRTPPPRLRRLTRVGMPLFRVETGEIARLNSGRATLHGIACVSIQKIWDRASQR